ncbi:MAG: peptide chain release factor N(5)-glutamine methyltransferase [Bacilli bacterium]|nr:peptide chain release factor N(5)-glutamine methyltransferase [Bacilli bacterium]
MPTIDEALKAAHAECKPYDIMARDLRVLIMANEGFHDQIDVIFHKDKEMTQYDLFRTQVERLKKNEPVEYIINEAEFLQHRLYVDHRVLIPRGETEELVSLISKKISKYYEPRNYLVCAEIGTGSGCITVALKESFKNWIIYPTDIKQDALDVAKINFAKEGTRCEPLLGDALEPFIAKNMQLDIIVSNPPYILNKEDAQDSVIDYEPASALWMDKEKNVYKSIFENYEKVKKGPIFMAFEISPDIVDYLKEIMAKNLKDYEYEFVDDLNGLTRFLVVYCK